jgi:hypothetical protein
MEPSPFQCARFDLPCCPACSVEPRAELRNYSAARRCAIQGRTNMRDLAGSAFLLVLLLPAFLAAGPPSGATPVVASEPMSGRSHAQAAKAACALPGACLAQASEGRGARRPVEGHKGTANFPAELVNVQRQPVITKSLLKNQELMSAVSIIHVM